MRQREDEIEALGLRVVVLTFETRELAGAYAGETGLHWPLLLDPARTLYQAYGMGRGSLWQIWGPATWWVYARLLARGRWPRPATGDVDQLGGDVLIDPEGRVILHHVGNGPADRPTVDSLLAPVRKSMVPGDGPRA